MSKKRPMMGRNHTHKLQSVKKNRAPNLCAYLRQILTNLQNSFTGKPYDETSHHHT